MRTKENPNSSNAPIDRLLSRLDGVREVGPAKWISKCPAHDDKSPSLSIRETADGRLLIHDFGGCGAADVVASIGLSLRDLFESPLGHHALQTKAPFPALPILKALAFESSIVFLSGAALLAGEPFDSERLRIAMDRIDAGLRVAEGRP